MKAPKYITALVCLANLPLNLSAHEALTFDTVVLNPLMATTAIRKGHPELNLKPGHNVIKVSVKGLAQKKEGNQPPLNVSLVIDRSSSMGGGKLKQAKNAAKAFIKRLSPNDIISVVAYDSTVDVIVPATKASDTEAILKSIDQIQIAGSTALFGGVSKGAGELRKFLSDQSVSRVLLLSDGQANIGPSSPQDLAELGRSLAKEGITVSTIGLGLGYNEDLMSQLAMTSDGTHSFIEEAANIGKVFDIEFRSLKTIVATELEATVTCSSGVRPIRVLGQEADIDGQNVNFEWLQLTSGQDRYFLLEVEVDPLAHGKTLTLGSSTLTYDDPNDGKDTRLTTANELGNITFTDKLARLNQKQVPEVAVNLVEQISIDSSQRAMALRDQGKIKEAKEIIQINITENRVINERFKSDQLEKINSEQEEFEKELGKSSKDYNRARKNLQSRNANWQQQKSGFYTNPSKNKNSKKNN